MRQRPRSFAQAAMRQMRQTTLPAGPNLSSLNRSLPGCNCVPIAANELGIYACAAAPEHEASAQQGGEACTAPDPRPGGRRKLRRAKRGGLAMEGTQLSRPVFCLPSNPGCGGSRALEPSRQPSAAGQRDKVARSARSTLPIGQPLVPLEERSLLCRPPRLGRLGLRDRPRELPAGRFSRAGASRRPLAGRPAGRRRHSLAGQRGDSIRPSASQISTSCRGKRAVTAGKRPQGAAKGRGARLERSSRGQTCRAGAGRRRPVRGRRFPPFAV